MFHAMPLYHMISMDEQLSDVYNVLRIVSGWKRSSLYGSPIDLATFIDISVI